MEKIIEFKITKATVLLTPATDKVVLRTSNFPCSFVKGAIPEQTPLDLSFDATKNTGIQYVKDVFGIEPEVINCR